jgi:hypothetical protein
VVVSVCFLAIGAGRLIEPEALGKDLARDRDAWQRDLPRPIQQSGHYAPAYASQMKSARRSARLMPIRIQP